MMAQHNDRISYQAVVRDLENRLLANKTVDVTVNIFNGTATSAVYTETHTVTTNMNGVVSFLIGNGTLVSGAWTEILWKNARITTEVAVNGTVLGTLEMPMTAVPYARYADNAGYADSVNIAVVQNFANDAITTFFNQITGEGYNVTVSVQADWEETNPNANSYIKNKPNLDLYAKKDTLSYYYTKVATDNLLGAKADTSSVYTKVQSDAKYLTSYTETDPTVPNWAKAENKPVYDYSEIQNTPTIPTVPTVVSAFTNDAGYITGYTEQQVLSISHDTIFLTGGSFVKLPAGFDGNYNSLTDKPELFSGNYNDLSNKPDLDLYAKKDTLSYYYTKVAADNLLGAKADTSSVYTKVQSDAKYLTSYTETDPTVPAWAKAENKPTYNYSEIQNTPVIPTVPTVVSAFTNDAGYITASDIPAAETQVNADWNAESGVAMILHKPTIPAVNDATLTIQKNGEDVATFTANATTNVAANISVPTTTGELINDAGFITQAYVDSLSKAFQDKVDSLKGIIEDVGSQYAKPPTVWTDEVLEIGSINATIKGTIFYGGGSAILQYGFIYGTTPDSTTFTSFIDNDAVTDLDADSSFIGVLPNLSTGTTYYVCAFARNIKGVAYGKVLNFNTYDNESIASQACPDAPTVTDIDGNVYNTVLIGDQCWTRENLRTVHCGDKEITLNSTSNSTDSSYRFCPDGDPNLVQQFGYLYNWVAVTQNRVSGSSPSGVQGICPKNWHVPSEEEWETLKNYVETQYLNVATALADKVGWTSSTVANSPGNHSSNNNSSGFSALPAGRSDRMNNHPDYSNRSQFWSTSKVSYYLVYNNNTLNRATTSTYGLAWGMSVRCIKNKDTLKVEKLPQVYTDTVKNVGVNLATIVATDSIIQGVGAPVTTRGVCWSATQTTPTIAGDKVTNGSGVGSFTTNITGLEPGTLYYVRAYATNNHGTAYGNTMTFTTFEDASELAAACEGNSIVQDYDGNVYNTVKIGNQCWTRENMRATHYSDDSVAISVQGSKYSATIGYCYPPNKKQYNVAKYGYLYNWYAATKGVSVDSCPGGVQGICPNGWHIPSDQEWETLIRFTRLNHYCNGDTLNNSKALAAETGWKTYSTLCTPGNNPEYNNSTGFSAMPAGWNSTSTEGRYAYFGQCSFIWSSSLKGSWGSMYEIIYSNKQVVHASGEVPSKTRGISVRCLRNSN